MTYNQPLAHRMRPRTIKEVIGQKHILGEGKMLRKMIDSKVFSSVILYGNPGIGKTSIAMAISNDLDIPFAKINAVTDGKKDLEKVAKEAKESQQKTLCFIDEIHRLTRPQVEFLLGYIEEGLLVLIGATTENPFHNIPGAILSRSQLFELKRLTTEEIITGIERALKDKERGLGNYNVSFEGDTLIFLAERTGGDLRSALNCLEIAVASNTTTENEEPFIITKEMIEEVTRNKAMYVEGSKGHKYDFLSPFHKSLRGSSVDSALYYMSILLESGDLIGVNRRILSACAEDVALANPTIFPIVHSLCQAAMEVGMPECRIMYSMAVHLICLSPKSNSSIMAIDRALADVRMGKVFEPPDYLKDAHYSGAAKLGRGIGYLYPHDFGGFVAQEMMPKEMEGVTYYEPKTNSKYEKQLAAYYENIKRLKGKPSQE